MPPVGVKRRGSILRQGRGTQLSNATTTTWAWQNLLTSRGNAHGPDAAAVSLIRDLYTAWLIKLCPEIHAEYPEILFFELESAWLADWRSNLNLRQFLFPLQPPPLPPPLLLLPLPWQSSLLFFMVRYNPLYVIGLCPVLGLIPHAGWQAPSVYTHGSTPFTVQLIRLRSQL